MPDFLISRRWTELSRLEWISIILGIIAVVLSWLTSSIAWLSNSLTSAGVALLAAVVGGLLKDWRWRRLLSQQHSDPQVIFYTRRGSYGRIIENVRKAQTVDLMGISLLYSLEYIRDNSSTIFRSISRLRILLPGERSICDARDIAQGSPVGSLWDSLSACRRTLDELCALHPASIQVRYFTIQPYLAMTRVDDRMWISPYITKSGNSSPVFSVDGRRSPTTFGIYQEHYENIWQRSSDSAMSSPCK